MIWLIFFVTACQSASVYSSVEDQRFVRPAKGLDDVSALYTKIFWLDATHVAFSANKLPGGWTAGPGELPKVITYDVISGTIATTPYSGEVECFAGGDIVIALQKAPQKPFLIGGKFGSELHHVELQSKFLDPQMGLSGSTCEPISTAGPSTIIPLRPGDGFVRTAHQILGSPPPPDVFELLDNGKNKVADIPYGLFEIPGGVNRLVYLPYRGAYFVHGTSGPAQRQAGYLFTADGHITAIPIDPIIQNFAVTGEGNAEDWIGANDAVVWAVSAFNRPINGLYVSGRGPTIQVDGQFLIRSAGFSPDGCTFFYQRGIREARPPADFISQSFATLNVCN